ncbi:MAG: sigma-70 family RNA polymerase sigma factor [Planctomycetes bacterium]|nr:sigma-70 family RNA polymerase sigma factor [Planctomycetota bacterium]
MVAIAHDPHLARREFLRRLMLSLGARGEEVEDLTQDALLRFYGRGYAERGLAEAIERALLARVGFSCLVDQRRRRSIFNLGEADVLLDAADDEQSLHEDEISALLDRAALSAEDRRLLELRFGQDRSLREIGRGLGLHVNGVKRRLDQILERLRRCADAGRRLEARERRTG